MALHSTPSIFNPVVTGSHLRSSGVSRSPDPTAKCDSCAARVFDGQETLSIQCLPCYIKTFLLPPPLSCLSSVEVCNSLSAALVTSLMPLRNTWQSRYHLNSFGVYTSVMFSISTLWWNRPAGLFQLVKQKLCTHSATNPSFPRTPHIPGHHQPAFCPCDNLRSLV